MKTLKQLNIDNLLSLWKSAAKPFGGFYSNDVFDCFQITDSDWPNKIHIKVKLHSSNLESIIDVIKKSQVNYTLPYWSDLEDVDNPLAISDTTFSISSEQIGMSLKLSEPIEHKASLRFTKVKGHRQAKLWADTFFHSFGYSIPERIILKTKNDIQYYLVTSKEQPIGTVVTYNTDRVMGIHALGVIPSMRKRGFGKGIITEIINKALDQKLDYTVLQSSQMARDMYLELGFLEDFKMINYKINRN